MITLLAGDCRDVLATLPAQSVQTIVTSPPYYGLRKYTDDPREIGQEPTPAAYVAALVAVFADCWRVLRDDGTLWLNLGDSYASKPGGPQGANGQRATRTFTSTDRGGIGDRPEKNLLGMPWRVALALQDAGWILRSDIIWAKPNPMPESVRDRPTRAHEYLFLFAKRQRYFYDATAIVEPISASTIARWGDRATDRTNAYSSAPDRNDYKPPSGEQSLGSRPDGTRNRRSVWTIATQPYAGAHFATMPEALIAPCILAGSSAQACETCGKAWGRVVDVTRLGLDELPHDHPEYRKTNVPRNRGNGDRNDENDMRRVPFHTDRGFAPRCACPANTGTARSIVLDPFGGTGTVARVAERHQRDSMLIDLNPAYIDLQEERTNGVQVEMQLC